MPMQIFGGLKRCIVGFVRIVNWVMLFTRGGKQLPRHSLLMKSKRCSHNSQSNHGDISQRIHVMRTSRVYHPKCKQNKKHGGRCQWEMQWLLFSLFNDFFYFEALQFGKFTSSWTSFLTQQFLRDEGKTTFC